MEYKRAETWFRQQGWKPFDFQKACWAHYRNGKSGLLNAPTGSGKTYALFVPAALDVDASIPYLQVLWITPLRALASDIAQAGERFAQNVVHGVTVGVRTGDSTEAEKARQRKKLPHILITTPESLHLLLARKGYSHDLRYLKAVIVDEWHELIGSKRGVQVELALSRLRGIAPTLRTWGISATIGNLQQAMKVLLGSTCMKSTPVLVRANRKKRIIVNSLVPQSMDTFPWRGHLGLHMLKQVIPVIKNSQTSLIFTNTRSQCELWYQAILQEDPELAGLLAMHHSSLEKETRLWVEQAIRNGTVKAVVCTSSLDLGVDFAPVDTIIQVGGPKGVARFVQRAGRSGHQPDKESVVFFVPTHAIELVEASALKRAIEQEAEEVENREPHLLSYDVLVQYLCSLAVSDGFTPETVFREVTGTHCYHHLRKDEWLWILNHITKGSQSLAHYDEFKRVEVDECGIYRINSRRLAMRHRMQIGTIVSDAEMKVKFAGGGYIGSVEEWFISRLKPGDRFIFSGRTLELVQIRNMEVIVRRSKSRTSNVVSWMGGRLSLSSKMSHLLRNEIYKLNEPEHQTNELRSLSSIVERQKKESVVPSTNELLVEQFETREGFHHVIYPFEGRQIHEALSSLIAYRISKITPITFSIAFNDYGFELLADQPLRPEVFQHELFSIYSYHQDLENSLNATEMAKRKFRDIAVISGLVQSGFPGNSTQNKHLQASSQLFFQVFGEYEPDNLLYQQAFRETFEHQLEEGRLLQVLERICKQNILVQQCKQPTPFSFPIITDRLRETMSSEKLEDRIKRMTLAYQ